MDAVVAFDPFTLYEQVDPYPLYRWLRDEAPVHHLDEPDLWVVTRYEHCTEVLRDPTTFSSKLGMRMAFGPVSQRSGSDEGFEGTEDLRVLIATDPPDHVRLRRLLSRPFTPREIGLNEDWIRPLCEERFGELLAMNASGGADWVKDFTWPFPVLVIGELLGIPASMRNDFKRWSDALIGIFVGGPEVGDDRLASLTEMLRFFDETIARRRSDPGDDLISMLAHKAEDDDEPLTAEELVWFCVLLLVAGNRRRPTCCRTPSKCLLPIPRSWVACSRIQRSSRERWRRCSATTLRCNRSPGGRVPRFRSTGPRSPQTQSCSPTWGRQTGTSVISRTLTGSTLSATQPTISASAAASISASGRPSPVSKPASHWR